MNEKTMERKQDPEAMDRIAKTLFAPVYPVLAEYFLKGFGRRNGTCLDLGSGPGHLAMAVAQASAMKVYALDRSPDVQVIIGKNLRDAGLKGKVIPLAGDVAKIPLADASVDLVVSRGSVYFWDDLNAAFCETARVLRPSGMAFIGGGFGNADLREQIVPAMAERKPGWEDFYRENMSNATTERLRQASSGIPGVTSDVRADDSGVWVVMRRGTVP